MMTGFSPCQPWSQEERSLRGYDDSKAQARRGAEAQFALGIDANTALKGRSSTVLHASTSAPCRRSYEIRQHAVRSRIQARIFFGHGQAREDICFEMKVGRRSRDFAQRRS
jgi:hypothetical protein